MPLRVQRRNFAPHSFTNIKHVDEPHDDTKYIKYKDLGVMQRGHNNFNNPQYDKLYKAAIDDPVSFWDERAKKVSWMKPYEKVLDDTDVRFPKWFVGGEINISYNCIDRHIDEGRGEWNALKFYSSYSGEEKNYTFNQLRE